LVPQLQDLLCGDGVSGGTARTHGDAGTLELFADCAPMSAELGTDLAEGPTLCVQVGCTLNVHRETVTSSLGTDQVISELRPETFTNATDQSKATHLVARGRATRRHAKRHPEHHEAQFGLRSTLVGTELALANMLASAPPGPSSA
jgi:hypothetical protein